MKTCVILTLLLMAAVSLADIQKRVTSGRACKAEESQQHVFVEARKEGKVGRCCGTLIQGGSWVITAGHCDVFGESLRVIGLNGDHVDVDQKDIKKHNSADLMLLKLSRTMSGDISLPADDDCKPENFQEMMASNTPSLVLVGQDTSSGDAGKIMCGDVHLGRASYEWKSTGQVVHLGITLSSQALEGDSGGGLVQKNALNKYVLQGVNTRYDTKETVSLDVCHYRTWISDTMTKNTKHHKKH
ncbi:hypothetical protein AALO_G00118320 [Alosa alosa]|uniref:Peptidase S1 domain-containing protein n=1 Tax=Alosa alosa TaxID=278164 RepID=A0AAV6GQV0_9TELE|nr:anionic trypsin-2-like [Alosa alosa]KAG5277498.1 hypothetical protein AALO_G00118320 [Alosa alosa]